MCCLRSADAQAYWNATVTLDYSSLDHDSQCEYSLPGSTFALAVFA